MEETAALCRANNEPPSVVLRCNTLKTTPEQLSEQLIKEEGLEVYPSPLVSEGVIVEKAYYLPELRSFQAGVVYCAG